MTKRLGLTGNIACGKSSVLDMLAELGAEVVDADHIVHTLLATPGPLVDRIAARFGREVIRPDGGVDRPALGAIVFRDPAALADLEAILYPEVIARVLALAEASRAPVFVIDAIKLIESGLADTCDQVWVVVCAPEQQLQRLIARNRLSEAEARLRIAAQPPVEEKLRRADVVIDNSSDLAATRAQVEAAWGRLVGAAAP